MDIKTIEINPKSQILYYDRAITKARLKDYSGAIMDFTNIINLNPGNAVAYYYRGNVTEDYGDINNACNDWKKTAELGYTKVVEKLANKCN